MAYAKNVLMRHRGWLMISTVATEDEPAPLPQGNPYYMYSGASPTSAVSVKTLIQGQRYTTGPSDSGFLVGYRLYTVTGNHYDVYVESPGGGILSVNSFVADSTGWREFQTAMNILRPNGTLSVVAITTEPDPTPVTWSGNWNYTLPNSAGVPAAGVVSHANKALASLRINVIDAGAADRGTVLRALTVGDTISALGVSWTIEAIVDNTTWIDFTVLPAVQAAPEGVTTFTFQTVSPTSITHVRDVNFWSANQKVKGLYSVAGKYADIVPDTNQYGVDIEVQPAYISPDWDVVVYSRELY